MKKTIYITLSLAAAFAIGAVFTSMTMNKKKIENLSFLSLKKKEVNCL